MYVKQLFVVPVLGAAVLAGFAIVTSVLEPGLGLLSAPTICCIVLAFTGVALEDRCGVALYMSSRLCTLLSMPMPVASPDCKMSAGSNGPSRDGSVMVPIWMSIISSSRWCLEHTCDSLHIRGSVGNRLILHFQYY